MYILQHVISTYSNFGEQKAHKYKKNYDYGSVLINIS